MSYETLKISREEHMAILSFNRPQAMNALSTGMALELPRALQELELEDDVFAVALTGEGDRSFCVGADLKERKNMTREEMRKQRSLFVKAFTAVAEFPKPLVAAVNGFALGGRNGICPVLRFYSGFGKRRVRAARGRSGGNARGRRHPAPAPGDRAE